MPVAQVNGIEIAYETHGDPANTPLLLVMGLGSQLAHWPDEFVNGLVDRGLYVIRHDNRDVGLSTKFEHLGVPDAFALMAKAYAGEEAKGPYHLNDMAADAVGLLDHLGIESAHVHGVSMGGMIVQTMAINHPEKVRSMISHMSSTGDPEVPPGKPEAMAALGSRPESSDRETVLNHQVGLRGAIGSPGYPTDEARVREYAGRAYDRCYHPEGSARQLAAIVTSGSRREALQKITAPTLVIHGTDDPLVPVEGGKDTAAHVPGARLELIEGYGHDLPLQLCDRFVDLVAGHIEQVEAGKVAAE